MQHNNIIRYVTDKYNISRDKAADYVCDIALRFAGDTMQRADTQARAIVVAGVCVAPSDPTHPPAPLWDALVGRAGAAIRADYDARVYALDWLAPDLAAVVDTIDQYPPTVA